jgi:hypothetical protein
MSTQQSILGENEVGSIAICDLLSRFKFSCQDEKSLQNGIETVLSCNEISYQRELHINKKDRPDFMLANGLAIEVKIKGSQSQFLRQASRYLLDDKITELILVGTPHWINSVPATLHNKPISKLRLLRSMF